VIVQQHATWPPVLLQEGMSPMCGGLDVSRALTLPGTKERPRRS
jgi:hypothetical protein